MPASKASAQAQFVALCKELRELGAVKVSGHGFEAVFAAPLQQKAVVAPVPREVKRTPAEPEKPMDPRAAFRDGVLSLADKASR
jgi:hypothetical protein